MSNKMRGNFFVEAVIYEKPKRREFRNVILSCWPVGNKHTQQGRHGAVDGSGAIF